jgi:FMNH2-dependent dimethyl sulfone monooxygenase
MPELRPRPRRYGERTERMGFGPLRQTMRLGIWAPRESYHSAAEIVRRAENFGFDTTLVAQRYLGRHLDAWILASALAVQTSKIELMIAVHPGMIGPQVIAKMGATLDQISDGRLAINIVNGWWREEMDLFGNGAWLDRSERRYKRMQEFIEVLTGLWTRESFSFHGEFFSFQSGRLLAKPIQMPHPPLYATSSSDLGREIVARHCNYFFLPYQPGHRSHETNLPRIASDIATMTHRSGSHGRKLRFGISATVVCTDSPRAAEAQADDIEERAKQLGKRPDSMVVGLGVGLVGTPQLIAERIHRYERVGVGCLLLQFPDMREGLQTFGTTVMPLLNRTAVHTN